MGRAACVAVAACGFVTLCCVPRCVLCCAVVCHAVLCRVVQGEFPLDVIPVDDDVLSLELDGAFR